MRAGRLLAAIGCLLLLLHASAQEQRPLDEAFERDVIVIAASEFVCFRFDVYLALSRDQKVRGLMFVRDLPETSGMLFIYDVEDYHSMWMKNTYIPLDMVFARSDGSVSSVITDTVPQTLNSHASIEPVRYVLELNGGTTRLLGIGNRSRIIWGDREQER